MLLIFHATMTWLLLVQHDEHYHSEIFSYHFKKCLTLFMPQFSVMVCQRSSSSSMNAHAIHIFKGRVFDGESPRLGDSSTLCVAASMACESHTLCIVNAKTIQGVCADLRGMPAPGDFACARLLIMDGELSRGTPTTSSWLSTQVYL